MLPPLLPLPLSLFPVPASGIVGGAELPLLAPPLLPLELDPPPDPLLLLPEPDPPLDPELDPLLLPELEPLLDPLLDPELDPLPLPDPLPPLLLPSVILMAGPLGVPQPVGPSKPAPALHSWVTVQLPLLPEVTS